MDDQTTMVEQYILLMEREKELRAQYIEVKEKREGLRDALAAQMDAEGVTGYYGAGGEKISITYYHRVRVTDYGSLTRWMEEKGVKDTYVVERFRITENRESGAPGLNNILGEARGLAQQSNRPVEDFLPPGLGYTVELGLRITQPRAGNNHAFDEAGKSVVELLKGAKNG